MRQRGHKSAFTLVELLVVIAIVVLLAGLAMPAYRMAILHANCTACASNMRALGVAFTSYATDNDGQLPGRVVGAGLDKWPTLLLPYVGDPKYYIDPGDPVATKVPLANLISNAKNNSSFFFNGFSDLGAYTNPALTVRLSNLTNLSSLLLLGQQKAGSGQYYMDFVEGNENDILNKTAYFAGSNYVYADGSARFMAQTDYNDKMWLVNTSYSIPVVPGH